MVWLIFGVSLVWGLMFLIGVGIVVVLFVVFCLMMCMLIIGYQLMMVGVVVKIMVYDVNGIMLSNLLKLSLSFYFFDMNLYVYNLMVNGMIVMVSFFFVVVMMVLIDVGGMVVNFLILMLVQVFWIFNMGYSSGVFVFMIILLMIKMQMSVIVNFYVGVVFSSYVMCF